MSTVATSAAVTDAASRVTFWTELCWAGDVLADEGRTAVFSPISPIRIDVGNFGLTYQKYHGKQSLTSAAPEYRNGNARCSYCDC